MKYISILFLLLAACGSGGESSDQAKSKNLFSRWQSENTIMDLTGMTFGSNDVDFKYAANAGCICDVEITGTNSMGEALVFNCANYGPVNYCHPGAVQYTYLNVDAKLTICDNASCEVYR